MRIRHKLWLEDDSGVLFGQGRMSLLESLKELGSLSAAAKKMGMSYRAAWGRIKASEERLGVSLTKPGEKGRGLTLSEEGERLLERYARFEKRAAEAIERIGREEFETELEVLASRDDTDRNR